MESAAANADCGYEVHVQPEGILLVNRRIWGLGYAMVVIGSIACVVLAVGVFEIIDAAAARRLATVLSVLALSLPFVLPMLFLWRKCRKRRRQSLDEMCAFLVLDRRTSTLRDDRGADMARLEDVHVRTGIDWMTRGMVRVVLLRWPGGHRVVFRTFRPSHLREVTELLTQVCGGEGVPG